MTALEAQQDTALFDSNITLYIHACLRLHSTEHPGTLQLLQGLQTSLCGRGDDLRGYREMRLNWRHAVQILGLCRGQC